MPTRTHRVRVLLPTSPERRTYAESSAHGFVLPPGSVDDLAALARSRVEGMGFRVRLVNHSPDRVINVLAEEVGLRDKPVRAVRR